MSQNPPIMSAQMVGESSPAAPEADSSARLVLAAELQRLLKMHGECVSGLQAATSAALPLDRDTRQAIVRGALQTAQAVQAGLRRLASAL